MGIGIGLLLVLASSLVVERGAKAVGVKADVDARRADARRSFIV